MTRSRMRKLKREQSNRKRGIAAFGPFAAAMAIAAPKARAQEPESDQPVLEEIIVTAQKREQNLQDVPLSITAIGTQELEELRVEDFDDFAKLLPSLSYTTGGPGFSRVFFRGVSSGDNGNHSGSLPSVGQYLDEQPITTIQGALDIHVYDIERIEALAGPQGTLYGASSQAGTLRIITNKPDPGEFEAGYDIEGNVVSSQAGYVAEGFVNVPIGEKAAIRLVGWSKRDAGYISNVAGSVTFPKATIAAGTPITANNASRAEDDYNDVDTYGGRAALRIDLNESWTVTPSVIGQLQKAAGAFSYDPSVGSYQVTRFRPESSRDDWLQAALTVEGKIANLDVVYAGSYLTRDVDTRQDYTDYSYFYDVLAGSVLYNDAGSVIDPTQYIQGKDRYDRQSHELRVSTPEDWRVRFVGGLFFQRQQHRIQQRYRVDDLAGIDDPLTTYPTCASTIPVVCNESLEVAGWPDTIWLTEQKRVDRDYAVFGEVSVDIIEKLTATGGIRLFRAKNSLEGYFGFGDGLSGSGNSGETLCSFQAGDPRYDRSSFVPYTSTGTAPCTNLHRTVTEYDYTPKINLTYRIDDDRLVYATWSKGFRPGGVNRRGTFPPYEADFLKNYELGFKSSWADSRLRVNSAFFWQDWDDFQFSFLGQNGLTNITNAGGARIWGIEADVEWAVTEGLLLSGGVTLLDGELTKDFCKSLDANGEPIVPVSACIANAIANGGTTPAAPIGTDAAAKGTTLPVVPDYKINLTGRYNFDIGDYGAYFQSSLVFQGETRSALVPEEEAILGRNRAYQLVDFSAGVETERFHAEFYIDNAFDERADIARTTQCDAKICARPYIITNQPRTIGIRFGQKF